jgi:hypothetical protein
MTRESAALRAEVEQAVTEEMERSGPSGFLKDDIVRRFTGRGAGRSTLYRWVTAILESGRPGQQLARQVKAAATARVERTPEAVAMAEAAASAAIDKLPMVVTVDDIAGGGGTIPVIEQLNECIAAARQVMAHSRTDSGLVRNARMLLAASEHLRRSLDTSARLHEQMMAVMQVERFHEAVFNVLRRQSPDLVKQVLGELRRLNADWGSARL